MSSPNKYNYLLDYQEGELLDLQLAFKTECQDTPAGFIQKIIDPEADSPIVGITSKRNLAIKNQ